VTLTTGGELSARTVVLATGADYTVPAVSGVAELWGTAVISCPFCHGWEVRDKRIGVLSAGDEQTSHLIPMLHRLSADVEVFESVVEVRAEDGALREVILPDGARVERDVLFVAARPRPRDASFTELALERSEPDLLTADAFGRTSAEGIYAAGDLVAAPPSVTQALATGQRAAVGVTRDFLVA
jgi:thioredoxin reductase